jgi:hypothetical protein
MDEAQIQQPVCLKPKINIGICTHRHMNPFFVNSMSHMEEYMRKTGIGFVKNSHVGVTCLSGGRQNRLQEAIDSECTHLLFVDDDMVFAFDVVHKMLHEMNQLTVAGITPIAMGVNACRKSPQGLFYTAKPVDSADPTEFLKSKGHGGVAEVSKCGLGVFLIEISVLREIPAPHFEVLWCPNISRYEASQEMMGLLAEPQEGVTDDWRERRDILLRKIEENKNRKDEYQGEDHYFSKKLRDYGVRIFVDQDISNQIGHAGEFIYTYSTYREPEEQKSA